MLDDWAGLCDDIGRTVVRGCIIAACLILAAGFCLGFLFGRFA